VPSLSIATLKKPMSLVSQEHQVAQQQQVSLKLDKKEQFLKERRLTRLTTTFPLAICYLIN